MSCIIPEITAGDDLVLFATLKKNDATFSINVAADVKARIISLNHKIAYTVSVAQSSTAPSANWANSLVTVVMSSEESGAIPIFGAAYLEIQVDDSGKTTFFGTVEIINGTIN